MSRKQLIKLIGLLLFIGAVAAGFVFGKRYISFEAIKAGQEKLSGWYSDNPAIFFVIYALIYVVSVGINVPGATLLTLLAGAIFGLVTGTVLVSFASTIGASLAFLVSRFLLRGWVEGKFSKQLAAINRGLEREGAFYLFTMRLIPAFPFFAINLVMGLSRMRLWTFYWVSQLGMLAGTIVYINAGTQLARIDSTGGLLSWQLWVSFAIIGIFPIAAKKCIGFYRRRRGEQVVEA